MFPFDFVSFAILSGIGFLGASLAPVIRLLQITRSRHLRRAWFWLAMMIVGFVFGYLALINLLPHDTNQILVKLICVVLIMGGVFVFSVAVLALQTAKDVERLVHLEKVVIIDPLTGVYNRRFFDEQLDREIGLAERAGTDLSLLMIDIDHFKSVNDTHGHAAGDRVLAVIAAVLNDSIRGSDVLTRYGGEEFAVIAPATNAEAAALLSERLCHMVSRKQVECPGGAKIAVTVSIGFATMSGGDAAETLFLRADAAVYKAKRSGRNRAVSGDPVDRTSTLKASVA